MKDFFFIIALIFLGSCVNTNSQTIQNIQVKEFKALIDQEDALIIDVRTPEEFQSGHIKEATNIDFYANNFIEKLKVVRKDVPVYVYCRSGGRSASAARKMEELGFIKVYNLDGGIGGWNAANYMTVTSKKEKKLNSPQFTVLEIQNILNDNQIVLIDFSTEWCVPCKKMKPIIQEIEKENPKIKVVFIDADINKELIKKYEINGVPVFIGFKNSKEVFRHVGIISKEEIVKAII